MVRASHIYRLGIKELWSLWRDPMMLILIVWGFTAMIYVAASAMPETLSKVPISIVDEDDSPLSVRISAAFFPPQFVPPVRVTLAEVDARITQAFTGTAYVQQIVMGEVNAFVQGYRANATMPVELAMRARFNPNLSQSWFGALMEVINMVTMLSIILSGAALIREREHGTIEHLLVMPVTPGEIMLGKVWSMGLVVLLATAFSLQFIVQGALAVPIEGSVLLFMAFTALFLFSTTSLGIFLATLARNMPQFGLLMMLVLLPMLMLSGGVTPRESMPMLARNIMEIAPSTHFVAAAQGILYRGAGFDVVWPQFLALAVIGVVFFLAAMLHFRRSISQMV